VCQGKQLNKKKLLTSLGDTVDAWASGETSGSLAFFEGLLLRVSRIFLTEALVTLGTTTGSAGSLAVTGDIEGAVVSSFGGSSSSLYRRKQVMYHTTETRQERCK
jgi:hypothetical protein